MTQPIASFLAMAALEHPAKHAAVEQWTADPCGPEIEAPPGTAEAIDQLLARRRSYAPWLSRALEYESAAGLDVLDVGCGQGIDVVEYARAGARVTGVDLTPRHVELAASHVASLGLSATVLHGDAEQLPFPDQSFDRVSSNGALHHTPDIGAALREIKRVLRPGGEARILVYNRRSFHYWLTQVLYWGIINRRLFHEGSMAGVLSRSVERTSVDARPLVRVYTPLRVERMLREAGLTATRTSVHGFNANDTPITYVIARYTRLLDSRALLEWLSRKGGWYVLGVGRRGW